MQKLTLTVRLNEPVTIKHGDMEMRVTLVHKNGTTEAKLAFEAPREVCIQRTRKVKNAEKPCVD